MSRVVRISEDALEITLKYGKNPSEGIRVMERLIQDREKMLREMGDLEIKLRDIIREELDMLRYRG